MKLSTGSAYYKILVYCTSRREELEKEMEPFDGSCSPEELAYARTLEELNGVINFVIEQAGGCPIRVSYLQMEEFKRQYDRGLFPSQRFGQAFCNHFNVSSTPEVFYQENRGLAMNLIYEMYITPKG